MISATPRLVYPNETWAATRNNLLPEFSPNQVLIEYTAHPRPASTCGMGGWWQSPRSRPPPRDALRPVAAAQQTVKLRVIEQGSGKVVPVKLHVHGEWGEYLAPVDRHRILNPAWFEDYSVDFAHSAAGRQRPAAFLHLYSRRDDLNLPLGKVYVEVSKGFEIRPCARWSK